VSSATESPEFDKFDTVAQKVLSVSHKELQKREKKYQRQRAKKKQGTVRVQRGPFRGQDFHDKARHSAEGRGREP
jgi:hypothetical protein